MSMRNLSIVFRKEILDIVRDRRTLIFMILLPVVVLPGLFGLMGKLTTSGVQRLREDTSTVALIGEQNAPSMGRLIRGLDQASGNMGFFMELADPVLAGGLRHMLTAEETEDVQLAAAARESMEERSLSDDDLGDARFLDLVEFEPATDAGRALFGDGVPAFLDDAARTRLVGSARVLVEQGFLDADETETPDPARLEDLGVMADYERIKGMSPAEYEALEQDLEALSVFGQELTAALESNRYHAILVLHDGFADDLHNDGTARYSIFYDESVDKSAITDRKVSSFLDRLSTGIVRWRVVGHDLQPTVLTPMTESEINVGRDRSILAVLLPYIVILMCFLGAIFPAIDLGAGEKERGTLETLLVTPAKRTELVMGKFLVITLSALIAAMLNIASLTMSVKLGIMKAMGATGLQFDPMAVLISAISILPVAALFAAALLALSIFARSYKEGQSYTGPIQFVVIVPALVSFIPGIELTIPLAMVPLVNVSLVLKEAWSGIFQWDCIAVLLISSAAYAAAMLAFCVKWFQREEVLFRT